MTSARHPKDGINLILGELQVHAGFHITSASEFAGGPIELEFFVEVAGPGSGYFLISSDADFSFAATFAGVPLADPFANAPDMGGPASVIEIATGRPWHQPLVLNQFVRLEDTINLLKPSASGQLVVDCRRSLLLAADEQAALAREDAAPLVQVQLAIELRRDDAQFVALVDRLIAEVRDGPPEQRERPLGFLLSLRAPAAIDKWRTLVNHPDPLVAERVRQSLWYSERYGTDHDKRKKE